MAKDLELTAKEEAFLLSMANVEGIGYNGKNDQAEKYREKYGCDPCDACGPDACHDCNACLGDSVGSNPINPFNRLKGRNNLA